MGAAAEYPKSLRLGQGDQTILVASFLLLLHYYLVVEEDSVVQVVSIVVAGTHEGLVAGSVEDHLAIGLVTEVAAV